MCSSFLKMMENYQGDLSDVVRATTVATDGGSTAAELAAAPAVSWQFSRNAVNYSSDPADHQDFGDPFSYIRDPHPPMQNAPLSELFYGGGGAGDAGINGGGGVNPAHGVVDDMKRPAANIFSRMLQISPTPKLPCDSQAAAPPPQRGLKGPPLLVSNNGSLISPSSSGLQISSPRNTGIKRRKSQAKKVVCIPAPAPANSRATGEIVPSDLWAWRKYGQKPIKGSPYPRGYYRCSSSKGCSARKQVERSRTDPNMLVITYTSEHNHPWPTQRNALAGSTRSQASKNSAKNSSPNSHTEKPTNTKQDHQETSSTVEENCGAVKEEAEQELENQFEAEFDEEFPHTYNPTLPASSSNHHDQDNFFADLGEIGDDPLNLFQQGFPRDNHHNDLDQFTFYDWATNTNPITATAATTTVAATTTLGAAEESNRHS